VTLGLPQFIPPNATAIALIRHGAMAGTAAAFIGAMQGRPRGGHQPPGRRARRRRTRHVSVMIASATAALLILATATPVYRRGGSRQLEGFSTPPADRPSHAAPTHA